MGVEQTPYLCNMKTIKDIITKKNRYTDIVDDKGNVVRRGREMSKNLTSSRSILSTTYEGGEYEVCIEKYQYEVCKYSEKLPYRHQYNGYKTQTLTRYRYTYSEGGKRLTSKEFKSLYDLILDKQEKTSKVKMGLNTMEVSEIE